jgi:hypothetical protein
MVGLPPVFVRLPAGDANLWIPPSSVSAHISLVPTLAEPGG